eukprot:5027178-Amphidinium_carterae.1
MAGFTPAALSSEARQRRARVDEWQVGRDALLLTPDWPQPVLMVGLTGAELSRRMHAEVVEFQAMAVMEHQVHCKPGVSLKQPRT